MSIEPEPDELPDEQVLDRVRVPGTLLMWVGIANLLGGLLLLQSGVHIWKKSPAEFREDQRDAARMLKDMGIAAVDAERPELGMSMDDLQTLNSRSFVGWAMLSFIGSFLTTYGGYNLRTLNSYKMAFAGSLFAAIPCTSPASCCGIGFVVGIWALMVLMNRDVRSAFP